MRLSLEWGAITPHAMGMPTPPRGVHPPHWGLKSIKFCLNLLNFTVFPPIWGVLPAENRKAGHAGTALFFTYFMHY